MTSGVVGALTIASLGVHGCIVGIFITQDVAVTLDDSDKRTNFWYPPGKRFWAQRETYQKHLFFPEEWTE